jgi:hypothetical protein
MTDTLWDVVHLEDRHDWLDIRRELRRYQHPDRYEYADLERSRQ